MVDPAIQQEQIPRFARDDNLIGDHGRGAKVTWYVPPGCRLALLIVRALDAALKRRST